MGRHFGVVSGFLVGLMLGLGGSASLPAGEFNEVLSIGDKAPDWAGLPGADGREHALKDYAGREALVLVFTCLSCPTATDYEDRLAALARRYEGKAAVVAVCVNRVPEDRLPKIVERVAARKLPFDYLYDESQKIARDHGAIFTPEFYVFDRDRKLVYMGAMDDATDPDKVTKRHVADAVDAVLAGKTPDVKEVIARGCRVRYARERRERDPK